MKHFRNFPHTSISCSNCFWLSVLILFAFVFFSVHLRISRYTVQCVITSTHHICTKSQHSKNPQQSCPTQFNSNQLNLTFNNEFLVFVSAHNFSVFQKKTQLSPFNMCCVCNTSADQWCVFDLFLPEQFFPFRFIY